MINYNQIFQDRTKTLAIKIIKCLSPIPYSDAVSIIRRQIIRSSTSVASNYKAMCRARSENERFAKLSIVVEEADETLYWLEIIKDLNLIAVATLNELMSETEEIVKALATYRKKLKP
ncbi:four helix bundle protein [Indibacter alkaliphilus]|nr:four helix bundle protein [Indibacter alkaliphilus]